MIPPPMTTYDFYSASTTAAVDNFIYTGSPTTTNPLTTTSDWRLRWHMEHGGGVMAFPTFPPFNEQNKQDVGFYMILTDLPEVNILIEIPPTPYKNEQDLSGFYIIWFECV